MEKLKKTMVIVFVVGFVLIPVLSIAGSLEPSAAPGPTMKTLDQIPPTWSQKLPATQRFELVLDSVAVLDKETGLVWEKSPDLFNPNRASFYSSIYDCFSKEVGGRMGWHLPTVEQLMSLVDKSQVASGLALPSGHPFIIDVQACSYWTSSTSPNGPDRAYVVFFDVGIPNSLNMFKGDPTVKHGHWCVRGGQTHDAY